MSQLTWLDDSSAGFPPTHAALDDPNGLLAIGGDLSPMRLLTAYQHGIFPWYSMGQPILWWTPSPRMTLIPQELHIGRSLKKLLRKSVFHIAVDTAFPQVIKNCALINRNGEDGTWITPEMMHAYCELHRLGYAHSIEAWQENQLVGGLYGVNIGKVFFGESMFSHVSGASKVAFTHLVLQLQQWNFKLIDCQIYTEYLASFGAKELERESFEYLLADAVRGPQENQWARHWSNIHI